MAATLDLPATTPVAYAMFAHCFTGSRFTPGAARVSKALAESGIACLRFDFPGLGQSEGDFSETTFSSNVRDIIAAATWLEDNYSAPQLLIGHSLGGAAALNAASSISSLRGVATIGAPFDPAHAVLHFADRIGDVDEQGAVALTLGGREVTISREFLEDLADTNPVDHLRRLRAPLLLVHSPIDQTVGVDNAQKIFQVTRYPKSLVSLDKADHLLTRDGTAQRAARIIRNWIDPFLVPENEIADRGPLPADVATATSIGTTRYADEVRTGATASSPTGRSRPVGATSATRPSPCWSPRSLPRRPSRSATPRARRASPSLTTSRSPSPESSPAMVPRPPCAAASPWSVT